MSTFEIGLLNTSYQITDTLNSIYPSDIYNFTLNNTESLQLSLTNISIPVEWQLKNQEGTTLQSGSINPTNSEAINLNNLIAGEYSLEFIQPNGDTNYSLNVAPLSQMEVESGFFTVGQTGQVGVDYLIDGGGYQGELAIFSLTGMEAFAPGSEVFIKEVARRSLSNSTLGYTVIKDTTEGAKFSPIFPWEGNLNKGEYQNIKLFDLKPGDKFGFMLVPNGTVQEVFNNPLISGAKRPLFSLATANPNDAFQVGQIADVTGDGKTFVMEDLRLDKSSDKDYNDVIFRVTGAQGKAVKLDEVINPLKDWREMEFVKDLIAYINTPPQFLQLTTKSIYQTDEVVNLSNAKVYDENRDLSQVNFWLKKNDEDWSELDSVTSFTFNDDWATFNYALPNLTEGNYELKTIAFDQQNQKSNEVVTTFQVNTANIAPSNLQFNIPQPSYFFGDTINITGGKVYEANGISDLKKVSFELQKEGGNWQPISDAVNFTPDSAENWGLFDYTLSGLEIGNYQLKAVAYDHSNAASNQVIQSFTIANKTIEAPVNLPPESLQFNILPDYTVGETISLAGKVFDPNGVSDLKKVDFQLKQENGNLQDISDVIQFNADSEGWGNFSYDLTGLAVGKYELLAIAYDQSNAASNQVSTNFTINLPPNRPPQSLDFNTLPLYTNNETISFGGAKVFDPDGTNDIANVFFWLGTLDGNGTGVGNVNQFTTDSRGRARFDFSYDLKGLKPGRYQLWAIAQDKAGNYSTPATQNFSVITDPGGIGLSDDVRLAIAEAANLESYDPQALAQTREWVVWVTPGQSSTELANLLGAEDLGATGQIPHTYTWKFSNNITPQDVANLLGTTNGVEFAYPLVPMEIELLHQPLDSLFSFQWNLKNTNVPTAWDIISSRTTQTVRGRNVVIGIVDDGIAYNHSDLQARYNAALSWDFTDYDNNPAPQSNKTFNGNLANPDVDILDITFEQRVNLTGMVTNIDISLDVNKFLSPTLPNPTELTIFLYSPDDSAFKPGNWGNSTSPWRFPGRDDLKFQQKVQLLIQPDGSVKFDKNKLQGAYAGGIWKLEIENPDINKYTENQMKQLSQQLLNSWKLQLETINPHGTAVAGIAAASEDSRGIIGVAPEAQLAGLRLIGNIDQFSGTYTSDGRLIADALFQTTPRLNQPNRNQFIDVFNNSWGPRYMNRQPLALAALEKGRIVGRNGLGNSYVFAAGNDGYWGGNVNYNSFANSRHAIAVAAVDNTGIHSPYSTTGASVLVSAPSDNGKKDGFVGIYTTSITKTNGYAKDFGGTSAAAPLVSGTIALMLEANPNLTARDIQHILVKTAQPTDVIKDALGNIQTGNGWTKNQAGYWFNDKYGFGVVDVTKAVSMAANWTPVANEDQIQSTVQGVNDEIPNGNGILEHSVIKIDRDITVETVEVVLDTDHQNWADLKVVLTSPDGTESVLAKPISGNVLPVQPQQVGKSINNWIFTSVRHWGESSQGEWKLQVFDQKGNEFEGEWNSWKLNIYGTKPTVTVTATDANASEDGNAAQFFVTRSGNTAKPLTINYSVLGSAINDRDYTILSGSITIPVGASMATLPIIPLADAEVEGDETVEVKLTATSTYNIGNQTSATATIIDTTGSSQYGPFVYTNPANGHLYILSQPDTWLGAQEQAKTLGGNLVTINDAAENNWLVNTFGRSRFWIGLTDSPIYGTTEGNFKWVNGEPATYTNWNNGNPDNVQFTPEGEDFVHINQGVGGTWNDIEHNFLLTYGIIEFDPATLTKPIVTIRATDAKAGEDGNAGQLIVTRIGNTTEPLTVNYSVLGNATNGTDYQNLSGNITIPAGASVASIPIIPIADNEVEGDETVVVKLLANDAYNVGAAETGTVTIANNNNLPVTPTIYINPVSGYQYFLTKPDTWLGAQEQAKAAGGNLVTVNNAAENAWLINTFGGGGKWMGLTDSPMYNATEGNYKWVSGEPVTYTNWWGTDNVLHTPEGEDFTEFGWGSQGQWNDMSSQQDWIRQGIVEITAPIPTNHWNARFINRTSTNVSDRNTYDFTNPAAILDLGIQDQGLNNGAIGLYRNWDLASPTNNVQTDNFAMEAWTQTTFEAGKLYKITTRSDDGIWFKLKNAQTGEWVGDSVVLGGDGADWRDRGVSQPPRTIFFKVPESGKYDFYVQYYEKGLRAIVDFDIEEAQFFQDSVSPQQWRSTVFWWDRKVGNVPPGDFYNNQNNIIGVVNQGSNTRSDAKKGINFNFLDFQSLNNDQRLPDNNYAIRSYTQANLESGVKYRAKVRADDGFQLLAKRANTSEWVYITPKDKWQQSYGGTTVDFEVTKDDLYDMHFHYYEERGDAALDLSWEVVPFTGNLLSTIGTNVRSGPGTNYEIVRSIPYNGTSVTLTFDKWTKGEFVDYTNGLGTSSDIWYRIAGTNQWISAAIVSPPQYDSTTNNSGPRAILVGTVIPDP